MDLREAIQHRHSVRRYTDEPIEPEVAADLRSLIDQANAESGLRMQLLTNEPEAYSTRIAHYGSFRNVRNYVAVVAPKGSAWEETCGYHGERVVLRAVQLGLQTCWVALSYSKSRTKGEVAPGERVLLTIALGHGESPGHAHKSKPIETLGGVVGDLPWPDWFRRGMEAAQLAPTALNQQKFRFWLQPDGLTIRATPGFAPYSRVDLGIAKMHFEVGTGLDGWRWV